MSGLLDNFYSFMEKEAGAELAARRDIKVAKATAPATPAPSPVADEGQRTTDLNLNLPPWAPMAALAAVAVLVFVAVK